MRQLPEAGKTILISKRKVFLMILKKVVEILMMQTMKLPAPPTLPPPLPTALPTLPTMILISADVGIVDILAIGVCLVFFMFITSQAANKKQVNKKKQDQPPKRRNML